VRGRETTTVESGQINDNTEFFLGLSNNRGPAQKTLNSQNHYNTKKMARIDKLARITAAVDAIRRGEFTYYADAARHYKCSQIAVSRRVKGLTKTRQEANLF